MIKSMTGFGKAECTCQSQKLTVEIKSLNSKYFDVNLRMPNGFRDRELEIRNMLLARLQRGKVEFSITIDDKSDISSYTINKALAKKYFEELKELSGAIEGEDFKDYIPVIMRLPDVMVTDKAEIEEEEWKQLATAIEKALDKVEDFRVGEGRSLKKDLEYRSEKIVELLGMVEPFEEQRFEGLKSKIQKDLNEIVNKENVDKNRFEQELVYYLDRLDITEEKVRLKEHCKYFLETLDGKESQGKKLAFITQEMGREINTLGSKASESNIQKLVVQMKDELEKIKEQLFNIV
jgi:uncharacterized protein (TIGR00255 family)